MSSNKREAHKSEYFDISGCISHYKMLDACRINIQKLSYNFVCARVNRIRTHTSTPSLTSSTSIWNLLVVPPLTCLDWFPIPELHLLPLENNNPSSLSTSLLHKKHTQCQTPLKRKAQNKAICTKPKFHQI